MNCSECHILMSEMLDGDLEVNASAGVREHLAVCGECEHVFAQLSDVLDACRGNSAELLPPNADAMWCRISNVIEGEIERDRHVAAVAEAVEAARPKRFWQFSFAQLGTAVASIVLISSVATFVVLRNYSQPASDDMISRSSQTQTPFEKVMSKVGLMDSPQEARDKRYKEQQAAIDYWNARVTVRKQQWDRRTRDAFERNLQVIDQSMHQYTAILQEDPDDELSAEMLDSVLNDKMNLLRDFSDL